METRIRPATVADAAAITAVHCSHVRAWRRSGRGDPAPYESLSLYDRWLHGGPWMSVETCAAHLDRWLQAGHLALAAEQDGRVVGAAEWVENREPPPYGPVLHLSLLYVHAAHGRQGVGQALVEAGAALAGERGCVALTTQPEEDAAPFYAHVGFEPWLWLREWQAPAIARPPDGEPQPVPCGPLPAGAWALRAGRYQCGRQAWHDLPLDPALTERGPLAWGRWKARLPGGVAWLGLRAQLLAPTQADGYIWTAPGAALELAVASLQALAAQLGFAYVDLLLEEPEGGDLARALGMELQGELELWRRTLVCHEFHELDTNCPRNL